MALPHAPEGDATATSENIGAFAWRRLRSIVYDPRPERIARLESDVAGRDFPLKVFLEAGWTLLEKRVVPDLLETAFTTMTAASSALRRTTSWTTVVVDALAFANRYDDALAYLEHADRHGLLDLFSLDRSPVLRPIRQRPAYLAVREHVRARAKEVEEAARRADLL